MNTRACEVSPNRHSVLSLHRFPGCVRTGGLVATAVIALFLCGFAEGAKAPDAKALDMAARVVRTSGMPGGVCSVIGDEDAELALALARHGSFTVHCLYTNPELCDRMRKAIRSGGMYGRVSAGTLTENRLPYTENLVNILVIDAGLVAAKDGVGRREILRVLTPLGTAFIGTSASDAESSRRLKALATSFRRERPPAGNLSIIEAGGEWLCVKKPWPGDIDEWTHYLHGPDGNPVAHDRVVGPPRRYQWTAGPRWMRSHESDSSVSTLVTARGRLFAIVDEAPVSLVGDHPLPDKWFLVARDAFNGVELWKVPIRRWGWREWKPSWFNTRPGDVPLNIQKRLVAVGDKVYVTLGYYAPVSQLDARTGELLKTYEGTNPTGEILYLDGTLVLSLLTEQGVKVIAVNAASGERIWKSQHAYRGTTVDYIRWRAMRGSTKPADLDPTINMAADEDVVALIDGPDIVCLDTRTGSERWRAAFPGAEADNRAGGIRTKGNLWTGTMVVEDGVVLHASPNKLAAFSADTGEPLWEQPKRYIGHLWYEWKDVFVIDGLVWTWGEKLERGMLKNARGKKRCPQYPVSVNGYDLKTGELSRKVPLGRIFKTHHHHRCYRNKATLRYIIASRRGTEFVDLEGREHTVDNWIRGTCHVGMMPANGLQYAPPHPCRCYIEEKLNGMNAMAPAMPEEYKRAKPPVAPRTERGRAFGKVRSVEAGEEDWPAFRHDSMRTGSVRTDVPEDATRLWRVDAGGDVSAPVVVSGKLFAAVVDEHHVVCLDVRDGSKLWEFAAGGRIDSPPTWYRGSVIFGSADGYVYCVRASDGALVWRFRAAPEDRLIGAFGQLESAWPVHGSVLIQEDIVYFAAGRSSHVDGGLYVFGLNASTGEPVHQTKLEGPRYIERPGETGDEDADDLEENYNLPMGALPDILMGDGSKIYMRSKTFDASLDSTEGRPSLRTNAGLLGGSYFKRMPWTFNGRDHARLIVHDSRSVYYIRMFDTLRGLDPSVYFTPGAKGYLLFAKDAEGGKGAWSERVPVRVRAMALASDRLFVAGPPDVVDPKDPLGAFEARKGGRLYVVDAKSGETVKKHRLPSPPVFNGAAAANGCLYIAEKDGSISCFGSPRKVSEATGQ